MPATVIAERIGWQHSMTILKERVRELRPLFVGVDPTDRVVYEPGQVAQCDLWFPPLLIPVGGGQARILPVLAMTCGYSRITGGVMIPSRRPATFWPGCGPSDRRLGREPADPGVGPGSGDRWHRQAHCAGRAFAGTLGVRIRLAPPRDPEFKGLVERRNGFFETSFLPGRTFTSPGRLQRPSSTTG